MKLLLVKPVVDFGKAKFPEDGTSKGKYIYRFHLLVFLYLFNIF